MAKRKTDKAVTVKAPDPKAMADGVPVWCDHSQLIDPATLKPDPANYNRHPVSQLDMIAVSIRAHGWQKPIVVDKKSGFIVTGHGETEAALKAGLKQVPVDLRFFATDAARRSWLIADNQLASLAEPDNAALKDLLENLDEVTGGNFAYDQLGFTEEAVENLMTQFHVEEAHAPELRDGDRAPFRQVTFTLHDEQWEEVEAAIGKAKKDGGGESAVNENSNGNALAWICRVFNGARNG